VEQNKRDFCVGEYTTGAPLSNAAALVKWPWNLKLRVHNFACVFFSANGTHLRCLSIFFGLCFLTGKSSLITGCG
jgi:hypothetical protein